MAMDHVIVASVGVLLSTVAPIAQKVSKLIFMSFSKYALDGFNEIMFVISVIYCLELISRNKLISKANAKTTRDKIDLEMRGNKLFLRLASFEFCAKFTNCKIDTYILLTKKNCMDSKLNNVCKIENSAMFVCLFE